MLESIALITGVGELSGGVTLPHSAGISSPGGEERIMTPRQDTPTLPMPDAASSSSWNIREMGGEPTTDSPAPMKKPLPKEMAGDS